MNYTTLKARLIRLSPLLAVAGVVASVHIVTVLPAFLIQRECTKQIKSTLKDPDSYQTRTPPYKILTTNKGVAYGWLMNAKNGFGAYGEPSEVYCVKSNRLPVPNVVLMDSDSESNQISKENVLSSISDEYERQRIARIEAARQAEEAARAAAEAERAAAEAARAAEHAAFQRQMQLLEQISQEEAESHRRWTEAVKNIHSPKNEE